MDQDTFWSLIERSRQAPAVRAAGAGSDEQDEAQAAALAELLTALPPAEIVAFDRRFTDLLVASETGRLYGAAMVINGSGSYDGFHYFRRWLLAQGRHVFEDALRDPETLAEVVEPGQEYEWSSVGGAAARAYEAVTGRGLPERGQDEPSPPFPGTDDAPGLDEADAQFPRLAARMWPEDTGEEEEGGR